MRPDCVTDLCAIQIIYLLTYLLIEYTDFTSYRTMQLHGFEIGYKKIYVKCLSCLLILIFVYMVIRQPCKCCHSQSQSVNIKLAIWLTRRLSNHYHKHVERKQTYRNSLLKHYVYTIRQLTAIGLGWPTDPVTIFSRQWYHVHASVWYAIHCDCIPLSVTLCYMSKIKMSSLKLFRCLVGRTFCVLSFITPNIVTDNLSSRTSQGRRPLTTYVWWTMSASRHWSQTTIAFCLINVSGCSTYSSVHCRWPNIFCCSRSSAEQSSIARHCCPLSLHLLLSS